MSELNNLDKLTEKIYLEGISKAEKESKNIISKAEEEQKKIIERAKEEAEQLIVQAKRESERLLRSVEKELRLKGKQLISDLQYEIQHLLNGKIVDEGIEGAFADEEFFKSVIIEALKTWKNEGTPELTLPKGLEHRLNSAFEKSIGQHAKNLSITFGTHISGGFRIGVKDGTYQISFTEQDFIQLFRPYLSKQAQKLLFTGS